MPAPLAVNWEALKAAYLQGLPLPEIARQHGVSYHALRARAHRYGWRKDAAQGAAMLQQAVTLSMQERGQLWGGRIATLMERRLAHLESLDPSKLKLSDLEALSRVTEVTDKTARRTFGLDREEARFQVRLDIANLGASAVGAWKDDEVITLEDAPQDGQVGASSGG